MATQCNPAHIRHVIAAISLSRECRIGAIVALQQIVETCKSHDKSTEIQLIAAQVAYRRLTPPTSEMHR